jgi:caffeoyl-CoA O-methyltransferase
MNLKYLALNESLYDYTCIHRSHAKDPILETLRIETEEKAGEFSRMLISREQGSFLSILVACLGAKSAIEIGTFTGYSSICIARGLPEDGRLLCMDISEEWTTIAQRHWDLAGVRDRIELRVGPAIEGLDQLDPVPSFDFAFIDADKPEYDAYYERILPRMRSNGLILFDNMLWGGRLGNGPITDEAGQAIDALNRKLASDDRVQTVLLPFADGIQFCRKK